MGYFTDLLNWITDYRRPCRVSNVAKCSGTRTKLPYRHCALAIHVTLAVLTCGYFLLFSRRTDLSRSQREVHTVERLGLQLIACTIDDTKKTRFSVNDKFQGKTRREGGARGESLDSACFFLRPHRRCNVLQQVLLRVSN